MIIAPREYDPRIAQSLRELEAAGLSVDLHSKRKSLLKFGRNEAVGTSRSTVMDLPGSELNETYVSSNAITHIASSSLSDTGTTVTIEGHTVANGLLTFVVQTKALAGQTKTPLDTPLARVSRVYASSGSPLVGTVYVAEDVTFTGGVPQTNTAIHIIVPAGYQQSRKGATSISSADVFILTAMTVSVLEKTAVFAEFQVEVKSYSSSIWTPITQTIACSSEKGTVILPFDPPRWILPNSDVRVVTAASTTAVDVTCALKGYLGSVIDDRR